MMIGPSPSGFMDTVDQSMAFMRLSRDHLLLNAGTVHMGSITNIAVMSKKKHYLDKLCTFVDTFHVRVRHSYQQFPSVHVCAQTCVCQWQSSCVCVILNFCSATFETKKVIASVYGV